MAKNTQELRFNGLTTPISSYDSTRFNLGTLIKKYTGATEIDNFIGPATIGLGRPLEASTAIAVAYPHIVSYNSTIDWVFLAENSAAAPTRRIVFYEYNKNTSIFTWKGFITLTYPTATNHTIRGFRVTRDLYTTGTVGVSGTAVTGSGTDFTTSRLAVGSRIGFGSTDPTQITTWYEISVIGSNTSITLTSGAGTISAGTPFVIEDLRVITTTTNATATNGGLFVTKGLRIENFSVGGTTIPAATTVDNIRAVYFLADAITATNTSAAGVAVVDKQSWTLQNVYVLNVSTPSGVFVYNVRAALTLTAGRDNLTNTIKTGNQVLTGTLSQTNNGRVGILNHGSGSGVESLYFATTTRVVRAEISNITNGSTTWVSDVMLEVPPGSTTTFPATGALASVEIASTIDRLVVLSTGAAGTRSYITRYNTTSDQFDHMFLVDDKQLDQSTSSINTVPHPSIQALQMSAWAENGILYLVRNGTTSVNNQIYTVPIGADWTYAASNNEVLITPSISTANASKLYRLYVNEIKNLGGEILGLQPEPFRVQYRTAGITDNSGSWTSIDSSFNLESITPTTAIQFRFLFKTIGTYCIPARIINIAVTFEDNGTDSHYEPSVLRSSLTGNTFAYRQSILWSSAIPNLRIRLYNTADNSLILNDTVLLSASGTWEYSSNNGATWNAWLSSADAVGNYIRYVANTLPSNTRIRALITQA
jgi:hypothetical protein